MPEHTIAENLTRLQNAKTAIGAAITEKGGTVGANDGLEDFANDIATIPSGGGGIVEEKDVNFYDYDGTIVNSYTAAEFAELSSFPNNPTHEGLTAQGWNWDTLANAKTYVANYGKLDIGQTYTTSDGKTRIYVTLTENMLHPYLGLYINGTVDVDWGDGSGHSTMTGTSATSNTVYTDHAYSAEGDYIITIEASEGSTIGLPNNTRSLILNADTVASGSDKEYINLITQINIGKGVPFLNYGAFAYCSYLKFITIPNSVETFSSYVFTYCLSLQNIIIPKSINRVIFQSFSYCYSLNNIILSNTVLTNGIETSTFYYDYSLKKIRIPEGITAIGSNAFNSNKTLNDITIPDTVATIDDSAFNGCSSLKEIKIPNSVTSIGSSCFMLCENLMTIIFTSSTPPTFGTSAFNSIFYKCKVYVPQGSLSAYKNAANKPSGAYIQWIEY